ncbi:hypothetical protein QCB45_08285 [Thiomicrorhabdus sp. ZW0627]|uniref:hypothetical protein n=1 Tax=Thiomicrorhabdus sp. ZW0627 TaxID=3039774 RepID=UPI00243732B5|nr:hypothetical protein [Thiomicrorhabdus sp. ZW0627]MDG6774328.1 hypothetical protein [Thiomicrorhabdus sp. ZW0627]
MKSLTIKSTFFATLIAFALTLTGCTAQPVHNYESQPVPTNIKSAEQVKKAIRLAGVSLGWIITDSGDNQLKGTLNLRKHQAVISIPYSEKEYSLIYKSSVALDYNPEEKTIHKNFNGWMQNLNNRIQVQLNGM